jgi:hypothetical protein
MSAFRMHVPRMHSALQPFAVLTLVLFLAGTPALAQTYRWIDDQGLVTLSDSLPADLSSVREISVIGDVSALSSFERRTLAIVNENLRMQHPNSAASLEHADTRDVTWRGATETVRDPCLISPDPRCHEKHAADYHPYFGYAPSIMRAAASPSAAGAPSPPE